MSRVFCVVNQKGGVGKTTTAVSLAAGMARSGAATLLIDLDPQCHATTGLGMNPLARHPFADSGKPIIQSIVPTAIQHLDILAGCGSFEEVELLVSLDEERREELVQRLREGIKKYEYVLIDCPPSRGRLTQTALGFSTEVLMPIQCEFYAMEGLVQQIRIIGDIIHRRQGELAFGGVVLTMYDPTLELTHEVDDQVREFFGEVVFKTVIPRDVALSEAPSYGKSIFEYAPRSRGARAYTELCMEVMERV